MVRCFLPDVFSLFLVLVLTEIGYMLKYISLLSAVSDFIMGLSAMVWSA